MNSRNDEALKGMLKTPSIMPMHEYMYLNGVNWADAHPSNETIKKVLELHNDFIKSNISDISAVEYIEKHWN